MTRWAPLAMALALSGCMFQNLQGAQRLQDQVFMFNDETRWGRVDLAADRVSPEYRQQFLLSHRRWGTEILVSETDLTNLAMSAEADNAIATVNVAWYDQRTMEAHSTILRQRWHKSGSLLLVGEDLVSGDPSLFDTAEPEADDDAPGDEAGVSPVATR